VTAFSDRLADAIRRRGNPVMVGLDPRRQQLPPGLLPEQGQPDRATQARAFAAFCRGVIEVVAPLVPAVKPQAAFFEQLGPHGMQALAEVIDCARQAGLLVVLDGKRNDIGSTAEAYADGYLGPPGKSAWGADALTVNPYLGSDSISPFVEVARRRDAGVFVLVKTSNPGGGTFQDLPTLTLPAEERADDQQTVIQLLRERRDMYVRASDFQSLYRQVGAFVERLAADSAGKCGYGMVGAVVGATYPEQLAELRAAMPHAWLLVPGYGSQGGTADDVAVAFDQRGLGALVNNSRGIIFAHAREPFAQRFGPQRWQEAVEAATREMIDQLRAATRAAG
jgi:orotidine-5'-phosphate decarboxylase